MNNLKQFNDFLWNLPTLADELMDEIFVQIVKEKEDIVQVHYSVIK